jgi:DNA-damage-inducible protein D
LAEENAPDFDSIKQITNEGVEYWSGRELAPFLGYTQWRNFLEPIKRAMITCVTVGQVVEDHFASVRKMVELGSGASRKVQDYQLSRYACYVIAENGDPRKPEIAAAQTYFALTTYQHEIEQLKEQQNQRLKLRQSVAEGNKELTRSAARSGVQRPNFGRFHNAGYEGLYGGLNLEQIKERKNINPSEDLLDRASLGELGANALRIAITKDKLDASSGLDEEGSIQTHHAVGSGIRKAIGEMGGKMPEDMPPEPSIKPLLEEKRRRQKKLSKVDPEQQTLF